MLFGVTFLFTLAKVNGTLDKLAHRAVAICRGSLGLIPIMFFFIAFVFGVIGPGSIASAALIGPMGMAVAGRVGIPALLMALMVANGSSASSLSPIAPTGIIVNGIMDKIGLPGHEWQNFLAVMVAHTIVGLLGYLALGGHRLFSRPAASEGDVPDGSVSALPNGHRLEAEHPFDRHQWLTMAVIVSLVTVVVFFDLNVGLAALAGAVVLVLARASDEASSWRQMPWSPILMVSGVTVLVTLVEKTGGMDLFSTMLARASSLETITGFTAALTGAVSIFSSTSGVVLPAFLPTVPGLITKLGGGDAVAIAHSMMVGAHLVDVSPLSTTGALLIAAAPAGTDMRHLFRWMLAWGVSMTVVAAVGCYLVFGAL
jgi:di/tricarboxylate transporter